MARQLRPFFVFGAFLPDGEHGSGRGDCVDVGGCCPEQGERPDPDGEIEQFSPTGPGHAEFNRKRLAEIEACAAIRCSAFEPRLTASAVTEHSRTEQTSWNDFVMLSRHAGIE